MGKKPSDVQSMLPILKRYCQAIAPSMWEAEDLVQDTFIRWYKFNTNQKQKQELSKAFLYQMATHTWIDQSRKQKIKEQALERSLLASEESDRFEIENAIELLVKNLTVKQSIIFFLHDVFEYKAKEIASFLTASEGAIKAALHRARNTLKKLDQEELEEKEELTTEQELLVQVMSQATLEQDPGVLLRLIPTLVMERASNSSSNLFCLAA